MHIGLHSSTGKSKGAIWLIIAFAVVVAVSIYFIKKKADTNEKEK
jgi:LPXTG-motif cell wall-anchored protein